MTDQITNEFQTQLGRYLAPLNLNDLSDAQLEEMLDGNSNIIPMASADEVKSRSSYSWLAVAAVVVLGAIITVVVWPESTTTPPGAPTTPQENLATIRPAFPKPLFEGTPVKSSLPNLEKPGKPRLEFNAPDGTSVVSIGAKVTSSDPLPIIGELSLVTDGIKDGGEGNYVELSFGKQWIQIDLGEEKEIWGILVWHFHKQALAYKDVVVQISNDPTFSDKVTTVFNNDHDDSLELGDGSDLAYIETNHGRIIETEGIKGRYLRLHSNGNSENDSNHYVEVEVWGK